MKNILQKQVKEKVIFLIICREPKLFNGGDFYFPDSKQKVKLKHNRAIFFPSMLEHGVSPVKMKTEPKEVGYGRYTITHFYISMPPGNIRV